jgi:TatD DNase family protein
MHFVDTHAHLYLDEFRYDIHQVIQHASNEGIRKIVLPNIDSLSISPLHNLVNQYPEICVPLMGLHPTYVKDSFETELQKIVVQFENFHYHGIGEIGIDLYWDKSFIQQQIEAFRQQLDFALGKSLPVVIHARDSFNEIMNVVRLPKYAGLKGVFHAYTGNAELAEEITQLGYKLGIGGILTFKNSGLSEAIRNIGLEHIVLETDSPYLAPVPFRGKRNECSYIRYVAEKLAEIKGVSIDEVAAITTRNAEQVFTL